MLDAKRREKISARSRAVRVATLRALSSIYEEQRLLSARSAPPLHDCCPDATECWSSLPLAARPSKSDSWGFVQDRPGSMIWPWVGERYEAGGVALLGLNFRSSDAEATVALEYLPASNDAEQFAVGDYKSRFNGDFPYRS